MIAKLKPANDIVVSSKMVLLSGSEYACDQIRHRLSMLKGEWAWDLDAGLPFYRDILVKGPNEALIQEIYRKEILAVAGIVEVSKVSLSIDPDTRLLSVDFEARYRDETEETTVSGTAG